MHQNHFHTGIEFARAVVKHFKLPANTLASMRMTTGSDEVFGLAIDIALTADDLANIAYHMGVRSLPPASSEVVLGLTFSAWMHDRNEAAHREMMAHAHRGGQCYARQG